MNKTKLEKGITLIALVITIIVLLILAGISISMLTGENGILNRAVIAREKTRRGEIIENLRLKIYEKQSENKGKITEKELKEILEEEGTLSDEKNILDRTLTTEKENYKIKVSEICNNLSPSPATLEEAKTTKDFAKDGNKQITDGKDTMWVPQDFTVVEGESIETGVVIEDGVGNQFVWVPVPNINEMFTDYEGKNVGKLYTFSGEGANVTSKEIPYETEGYREPDILTSTSDGDKRTGGIDQLKNIVKVSTTPKEGSSAKEENDIIIENWEDELKDNFNKMRESVEKYKGFYIGRYETSDLGGGHLKVQKEQVASTHTQWYTMYKNSENIAYKNETEKITSVTSSMIWGCQWDATLNWFLRSEDEKIKGYVTDSTGKGWYKGNGGKKYTGTPIGNDENQVNKIWDMAGNVEEFTLEANDTYYRVVRGGDFYGSGSSRPVNYRENAYTYSSNDYIGSRSALYINK